MWGSETHMNRIKNSKSKMQKNSWKLVHENFLNNLFCKVLVKKWPYLSAELASIIYRDLMQKLPFLRILYPNFLSLSICKQLKSLISKSRILKMDLGEILCKTGCNLTLKVHPFQSRLNSGCMLLSTLGVAARHHGKSLKGVGK